MQEVAKTAVLQQTPNWTAPMRNSTIDQEEITEIRKNYPNNFARCRQRPMAFQYTPDKRKALDLSREKREAVPWDLYKRRGLVKCLGNFHDIFTDQQANDVFSAGMADRVRERVHDLVLAGALIPLKTHGFGTRRVPLETSYDEAFPQSKVTWLDLRESPIQEITATSIRTAPDRNKCQLAMLIHATGPDALTESYEQIDYKGIHGLRLSENWERGSKTYLGFTIPGFPTMFNVLDPQ
ncbi:hypothetical protein BJX64DRAFT_285277 [Aspergillus heterothallicus]